MGTPPTTLRIGKGAAPAPSPDTLKPQAAPTLADSLDAYLRQQGTGALMRVRRNGRAQSLLAQYAVATQQPGT